MTKTITNKEFVKEVAAKTGMKQKEVAEVLSVAGDVAYHHMAKLERVKIFNGLTLFGRISSPRVGRNPKSGELINIPSKNSPKAAFGKYAKDIVFGLI